ncbi:TolB family protein, partial [Bacteroidota bacterium]
EVKLSNKDSDTFIKIKMLKHAKYSISRSRDNEFYISFRNTSIDFDNDTSFSLQGNIKDIEILSAKDDAIIKIKFDSSAVAYEIIETKNNNEFFLHFFYREESDWYEKESEHFKLIYRESHAHLANHILSCAENSLKRLIPIFDYSPKDKIIINTYDASDYGFGATTNVPQNYIRLEIESFEPGYEAIPYNERIQWLLSHELVHIVVNDEESDLETAVRDLFRKVPPEKSQPFTTIYSVLGNFTRFTPRWYQEGIAVFMETWLSGGYGRTLGSFDEMYFRSLILEGKKFPSHWDIETILSHNSIFLENIFYFYGTRFASYLSIHHGVDKLIDWYRTYPNQNLVGFIGKFSDVFGEDFYDAWNKFAREEKLFQEKNIEVLKSAKLTEVNKLSKNTFGWVTQPYFDSQTLSIIYGYHRSAHLATLQKFHLLTRNSEDLNTLPTPSIYQVASTAYDASNNLFFYTTNNNRLYRDVWVVDLLTKEEKIIFPDSRIGNITISTKTHDLWGVQQQGGLSTLVVSQYPYQEIVPIYSFDFGEELSHLAVSKSGEKLAAVLHRANGQQSIILFDVGELLSAESISFNILTSDGSPENPSWSEDGKTIYWNAYTNGVSNIYSYKFSDETTTALSHCLTGLFKPIEISPDSIFAFEFTTDGFLPVMIANEPAVYLPAIQYYGQRIMNKNPKVYDWVLKDAAKTVDGKSFTKEKTYNGLENLHIHSFVPVLSGFQSQIVFGIFTRISDPLLLHDFYMEFGISPLNESPSYPFWHLRLKYDYKQKFYISYSLNGPDFFDLFNSRKRGMIGSQFRIGHSHYWLYDKPHTIKQQASIAFYTGVEFINDNLVRTSEPDFSVTSYNLTSTNLRRTIGSSDHEQGEQVTFTLTLYGTNFYEKVEALLNGYLEYDRYSLWLADHNVAHLKLAGGYMLDNEEVIQGRFYFGGFGNRQVDNGEIRQFRKVFRYPGIPIYSLMTTKFFKLMFENAFPPIRVSGWALGNQYINHFDFSIYSQSLITESEFGNYWVDIGAQLDIKFKHWYNLETTFSAGAAKAWSEKMTDWEWFLSIKLLKN